MSKSRELDALVGHHVMGLHEVEVWDDFDEGRKVVIGNVPEYSTDIKAAWKVVEKVGLSVVRLRGRWVAGTHDDSEIWLEGVDWPPADTAPLAICLAALKACGVHLPDGE